MAVGLKSKHFEVVELSFSMLQEIYYHRGYEKWLLKNCSRD